ncbi:hypothetical protein A2Z00_05050 [Candidatus Gottesmanbacteria bacterium RBG_13_45_10]|uniref:GIY-YIG domain-containing protein n=1 Tax=Candidatus Gottesmanbacteria bacterium RBG_13_45_10 TaxID=1798370 RepID=A0A1F5ZHI2_9BACT|nr:MAG: hypothetical protein A2Z00_05050 [Candidatus Gottesmanbacteria bacterium RBG_13_45_10]
MKFYYVYVLRNSSKDFIYIGYSENLKQRFASHNKGENISTKPYIPLELIHYEAYKNMADAKRRELYLKSNRGRTTLLTMLKEYFLRTDLVEGRSGIPKPKRRIPSPTAK